MSRFIEMKKVKKKNRIEDYIFNEVGKWCGIFYWNFLNSKHLFIDHNLLYRQMNEELRRVRYL